MDIDYDAEAGAAYYAVQLSAKEVITAGRRQNYCNMMDLLATSCKTSGLLATSFTDDELVEFWLKDILPLMFDADQKIQNSALAAVAEALVALDVSVIHAAQNWPQIRTDLVQKFVPLIAEMRDAKNSNWHKIWSLMVQIMDDELLRGCTYINKFLNVVELGFRSPDNNVRSESFLCWRVLIKIFAAYNELSSTKRMRLLLIPLKTSQSRSPHVSGIKLRVWWYLLTCLDRELVKSFDNAVEYFLTFVFGGGTRSTGMGLIHNYQTARELALPCLVALMNMEPSEPLQRILRELRLESLSQPSPLMCVEVMRPNWSPLLTACVSGYTLLSDNDSSETEQLLLQMLMRNLTLAMFKLGLPGLIVALCIELEKANGRVVRLVFNTIASENLSMKRAEGSDGLDIFEALMTLCIKSKQEVPSAILHRCISLMFSSEHLEATSQEDFRLISSFAQLLMRTNDEEDYESFSIKLIIWRQVSSSLATYLRDNALEYRVSENASLLDSWLLWPLKTCAGFAGRRVHNAFDSAFCEQWRQLLSAGQNASERKVFLGDLKNALMDFLKSSKEEQQFPEFFDAYVTAVLKLGICKDTPLYKDVFGLLQVVFENPTQQALEACLNTLRNMILDLRQNELMVVFDALKPILTLAIQSWSKHKCEGSFLDEWKRAIQEKFRKLPMKSMANQLKSLFKGEELFVIIPSVWSLNPEKLTERQKERMAEKSDIPALYNDMSQSQDNSIKPWTPKKVVISKSKQGEIAIAGKDDEQTDVVVIEDTPIEELGTPSKPVEKYNFRKPRNLLEDESVKSTEETTPMRQTRKRAAQKEALAEKPETVKSPKNQTHTTGVTTVSSKTAVAASPKSTKTSADLQKPANIAMQSEDLFADLGVATSSATAAAATSSPPTQVSVQQVAKPIAETPSTIVPMETASLVPPTQIMPETNSDPTPAIPLTTNQEMSPKKSSTRLCNLSSPPDRKQTSNLTSPTLRPKPTGHLTGRGAQLINMIRNKKLDTASPYNQLTAANSHTTRIHQVTPARSIDRSEQVSTPTCELSELPGAEHTSTPLQAKDLLIFSKRLPSPSASPSASILKRKLRCESIDDFSMESPAMKRKRVSFHDPPVSVTKEYLRDTEETRSKTKRCLLMDKIAQTSETKQALKRRGRLDSIIEIERFAHEQTARLASTEKAIEKTNEVPIEDEAFATLKWNDTLNPTSNKEDTKRTTGEDIDGNATCVQDLAIMDPDAALDLVVEKCSLETILERFCAKSTNPSLKNANILAKFLSNQMSGNDKLKTTVLETLSENHSKDFLDHAVRENLSSVVCDRLNPNSVLDYICAKSKINNNCRTNLLSQVVDILKTSSRTEAERFAFLQQLLLQCSFTDEQLLDIIGQLMVVRDTRSSNNQNLMGHDNVAETAADSSSNL
ncbi:telomere-associated protein RIF1 isoform X1 [Drosophila willistoni]|uniref:telomere-associated protein RIF1 isoform X1 n=1 Tax=Drosophila willistoni TaxID=7260 RepID=UPI00017D6636|nr:telomere-associated protein RIF1 isoform X1 [Drosophila willistoni]